MSMAEVQAAAEVITSAVSPDANIIFGASIRPELEDELVITVVATGFDSDYYYRDTEDTAVSEEPEPVISEESNNNQANNDVVAQSSTNASDFATANSGNYWDSIKTESDEDLDVPPSLRGRFRKK